ncbi:hypothetical protein ACWAU3_17675 [Shewanella sp. JL219SE-S6]
METEKIILWGLEAKDIISIGALGVAFLALFIAPIANARISKRQIIAPMRQAWINSLRDKISEILAIVSISRLNYCPSSHWNDERKEKANKRDLENYERLMLLKASVSLHINASESDHTDLIELISIVVNQYHDSTVSDENKTKLLDLSRKVLKDEWEATKKT